MEVGKVAVAAQAVTAREGPRQQPTARTDKAKATTVEPFAPKTAAADVVKVSANAKGAGQESKEVKTAPTNESPQPVVRDEGSKAVDTRRAYNLENGDLVVSIVNDNEVVKQIPAEDQRKIKQAIQKYIAEAPAINGAAPASAEESGPGEKGEQTEESADKVATVADLVT